MKRILSLFIVVTMTLCMLIITPTYAKTITSNGKNVSQENAQVVGLNDTIKGTLTYKNCYHYYKISVPANKTIKLKVSSTKVGHNYITQNASSGNSSYRQPSGISVENLDISGENIPFGTTKNVYLNGGVYFISIDAYDEMAEIHGDSVYLSGYKTVDYTMTLSYEVLDDIAPNINGPLFKDSKQVELNKLYKGVQTLWVYDSLTGGDAPAGNSADVYRIKLNEKSKLNIQLSNFGDNKFTYISIYKETKSNIGKFILNNKKEVIKNGLKGKVTKNNNLLIDLEKGNYFICFAFLKEAFAPQGERIHSNGTPYQFKISTVSIKKNVSTLTYSKIATQTYTGKQIKPSIVVKHGTKTLKNGTDYTLSYGTNKSSGTGTVKITGKGNYTGSITKTFIINKRNVSTLTYSKISNKSYTGKQIKPSIIVKYSGKTLKNGTDYTISYGKNKSTGKGTVKITGKGNYIGSITKTFYIVPKKVTISSAKSSAKKKITVKYKKVTGASGYQIAYQKSGSKKWTYTTVSSKSASKTLTKLTSKKNYKVKVRAYKTVSGKKYYGTYSAAKTVKVK